MQLPTQANDWVKLQMQRCLKHAFCRAFCRLPNTHIHTNTSVLQQTPAELFGSLPTVADCLAFVGPTLSVQPTLHLYLSMGKETAFAFTHTSSLSSLPVCRFCFPPCQLPILSRPATHPRRFFFPSHSPTLPTGPTPCLAFPYAHHTRPSCSPRVRPPGGEIVGQLLNVAIFATSLQAFLQSLQALLRSHLLQRASLQIL